MNGFTIDDFADPARLVARPHDLDPAALDGNARGSDHAYRPPLDPAQWREVSREAHAASSADGFDYAFVTYERPSAAS